VTITVTGSTETLEETVGVKSEGASYKRLAWDSLPFEGETSGASARVTFEVWSDKSAAHAPMSRFDKRKDVNEVYEGLKTEFQGLCLNAKRKVKAPWVSIGSKLSFKSSKGEQPGGKSDSW